MSATVQKGGEDIILPGQRDFVTTSLNHPLGSVANTLLNLQIGKNRKYEKGLYEPAKNLMQTILENRQDNHFRYGHCMLARRAIDLFLFDQAWSKEHLLPLFSWDNHPEEAPFVWQGYLTNASWNMDFLAEMKGDILATVLHFSELDRYAEAHISLIANIALYPTNIITKREVRGCVEALSLEEKAGLLLSSIASYFEAHEEAPKEFGTNQ